MTHVILLDPDSSTPDWVEEMELLEFGSVWEAMSEFEMLWLADNHAFARWRVYPQIGEAGLSRIAVTKSQRRTGIAKHLLNECIKYLAANGITLLHLEVRVSNIAAQKLYESMGWKQISIRKAYYSNGEDAIVYVLGQA